ncbi:hypothetical protein HPB47_019612 [Ixodes persulcatus]|uniref:Uncharacterized protein n=1 Tax=Ixodes persulcatus TaxID=34615 RepID=A0AC60QKD3_IXOPE|nr:hypothetical protein HPB47_019612 [Ixodes persulcatus]
MMRRVATRIRGLKEQDLLRLRDALIISRIQYQAPYVSLTRTSERKLDALIRKATKIALGLPLTTSTARLVQLGVLPTVSDIIDIHRIHQRQRLSLTPTGRLILHELGYTPHPTGPQPTPLDNTILQHITVAPIPRHMDRDRNPTRRLLRAAYYTRKISRDPESHHVFTDAALKDTLGDPLPFCSRCLTPSDQDHLLWDCPHNPAQPHTYTREWLALAVSLEQQRELVAHINRALSGCLD